MSGMVSTGCCPRGRRRGHRGGVGEQREAALGLRLEQFEDGLSRAAALELELGLKPEPAVRLRRVGEGGRGRDSLGLELADLRALAAGDEQEMVDLLPPALAEREELADRAVVARTDERVRQAMSV